MTSTIGFQSQPMQPANDPLPAGVTISQGGAGQDPAGTLEIGSGFQGGVSNIFTRYHDQQVAAQQQAAGGAAAAPGSSASGSSTDPNGQQNAMAILNNELNSWGLGSLANQVWGWVTAGMGPDQILYNIRQTDTYKQRFPAMAQRQAAGLPAISESDYVNLETTYRQIAQQYGLPAGFYDNTGDFTGLIAGDVSPTEYAARVEQGYSQVANAPAAVQQAFAQYYGVSGQGALASLFLDQTKATPVLERMAQVAQVGGSAIEHGQTMLQHTAEQVQAAGISQFQQQAAFQQAGQWRPLESQTVGEANQQQKAMSLDELQQAAFGLSSEDQLAVAKLLMQRNAAVTGSGGAQVLSTGATGLGSSLPAE